MKRMRGRKPTPTILKLLAGNPGKRPLPAHEPRPEVADEFPAAPEWLTRRSAVRITYRQEAGKWRWFGEYEDPVTGKAAAEILRMPRRRGPGRLVRNQAEAEEARTAFERRVQERDPAIETWNRVGVELYRLGLLTVLDYEAFACYCQSVADYQRALDLGKGAKPFVKTAKGYVMPHPAIALRNKALEQIRALATDFGLTPAGRVRVKATGEGGVGDELEDFLGSRRTG